MAAMRPTVATVATGASGSAVAVRREASAVGRAGERVVALAAMLWAGLMAGFFLAFDTLVIPGIDDANVLVALPAMQSIAGATDGSLFGVVFYGAAVLATAAIAIGATRRDGLASWLTALAGATFLVGVFLVTLVFNRPLDNDLASWSATSPSSIGLLDGYLRDWARWNDVRLVAALASFGLFATAGLLRLRVPRPPRRVARDVAPVADAGDPAWLPAGEPDR